MEQGILGGEVRSHCITLPQGRGEVALPSASSAAARGHHMTSTTTITSSIRTTSLGESRTSLRLFFLPSSDSCAEHLTPLVTQISLIEL